jgi:hypothetical protein
MLIRYESGSDQGIMSGSRVGVSFIDSTDDQNHLAHRKVLLIVYDDNPAPEANMRVVVAVVKTIGIFDDMVDVLVEEANVRIGNLFQDNE